MKKKKQQKAKCKCRKGFNECCDICTGYAEAKKNGTLKDKEI